MALTDTAVRSAKARQKQYKLSDGDGLYLLVKPNGGKYWRLKYMFDKKERLLALGTYPEVSLGDAREKRFAARKQISIGKDPSALRKEEKKLKTYNNRNSFQLVAQEWFETNKSKWLPSHAARIWRRLELHIFPTLGRFPISELKALDLLEVLRQVEKSGATETAHRLLQTCTVIFRYGIVTQRIQYNPANDLKGALTPHKAENYPTIQAKHLPEFFTQLKKVETTELNKVAVRLLLLTFVRQGELRQAKWDDIDFKTKEWRLPAHTTKMKREHIVPLAKQTIRLLKELKMLVGSSPFLFPSQQQRRHSIMSENTINHVLQKMGYKKRMVGHGFRALASTSLNEMGYPPDVIERQLAHSERNKVRAAYNRAEYLTQRHEMMQAWGDFLDSTIKQSKTTNQGRDAA